MQEIDVMIVGAGPIGIELAITLHRMGVSYCLLEAKQIGNEFSKWPPDTHFFSTNEHVALAGIPVHNTDQRTISGEQYLAYLRMLVEMFDLNLRVYQPVREIAKQPDGTFIVSAESRTGIEQYHAKYVVLATGNMAGPRWLNIEGEKLPHVSHYFAGPHPYFHTKLLIVGGRNSAVEAALRCWRAGADVTLSYRRADFDWSRIKPHLAGDLQDRITKGDIQVYLETMPIRITPTEVELAKGEERINCSADFVLLATGFQADMTLLANAGITLVGEEQAPIINPQTMESNVPNLFVAGTAVGGTQPKAIYFISTSHEHVAKIVCAITGQTPQQLGSVAKRQHYVKWQEVQAN